MEHILSRPIKRTHNWLVTLAEGLIYNGRWAVAPMYVGLFLILIVYTYKFLQELYHLVFCIQTINESELLLSALQMVDNVMIANLLLIITIGSYSIFIRKLDTITDKPAWLEHITSGSLKIKMGMSLIGVSSIHLLKDFIGAETIDMNFIYKHVLIHIVFIISTLALALTDKIGHPTGADHITTH